MSERFDQLSARHSELLVRCAAQRQQLVETAQEIEGELGRVDRGIAVLRRVVRSPAVFVGSIAVVALIGPRRLLRWVAQGLMLYTSARRLIRPGSGAIVPKHDGG